MKKAYRQVVVRQAHHERNLEPLTLSLSKGPLPEFFITLLGLLTDYAQTAGEARGEDRGRVGVAPQFRFEIRLS